MARPKAPTPKVPATLTASPRVEQVSGNTIDGKALASFAASGAVYRPGRKKDVATDRHQIAQWWQIEAYRHLNICGEARYAAALFSSIAGRAEIGVSEPQALSGKAKWVTSGPEVDAFNELAPTVRERSKLIRDYMLHYIVAGECYLISRERKDTDPEYSTLGHMPVWEIVSVTELQKMGDDRWRVRYDNGNYIDLAPDDPVIRMWNPDPENRREAWSPFRSMLSTLREIEWLTKHIFTQVQSRLMSSGVWFLPENLTFAPPPPDAVEGGAEAIAKMNEAEQFMASLAASSMAMMDADEVSFPTIVMSDPLALAAIEQDKLIKFWSEIDDKAMILRSDAVRRFALGMDLPPEQVLGSSGIAVTGGGGSAGSVNHWGVWANEEQTISAHVEPALDIFVGTLTSAFLREAVENTLKVIAYDTATLRLRQDRSKESMELYDRGLIKGEIVVRENGFDPESDMLTSEEHKIWLLNRIVSGTATPEQMQAAMFLLTGVELPVQEAPEGAGDAAPELPGRNQPRSLEEHPYQGPPREQHDHSDAPFAALLASAEVLVLRALEKAGNRVLNDGKRGKDRDRTTPAHMAHLTAGLQAVPTFDFSLVSTVFGDLPAIKQAKVEGLMARYCRGLYANKEPYRREDLSALLKEV